MGKQKNNPEIRGSSKNQLKISNFFKKQHENTLSNAIEPKQKMLPIKTTNSVHNQCNNVSPSKDVEIKVLGTAALDDADIEIIESTPENKASNAITNRITDKPQLAPCNSNDGNNYSSSFKFKDSLFKSEENGKIELPSNNFPQKRLFIKTQPRKPAMSINMTSYSQKRAAEGRTGISPNTKRFSENDNVGFDFRLENIDNILKKDCKANLLEKLEEPFHCNLSDTSDNDNSFRILQSSLKDLKFLTDEVTRNSHNFIEASTANSSSSSVFTDPIRGEVNNVDNSRPVIVKNGVFSENAISAEDDDSLFAMLDLEELSSQKPSTAITKIKKDHKISSPSSFVVQENYGRHVVECICRDPYKGEVTLNITSATDNCKRVCILSGFWCETIIKEGDVVHILSAPEINGALIVSDEKGIIVVNPDLLLSGTSVVSGVYCRRKAVLNEKFKGYDSGNRLMIVGSLVHQLFQEVLMLKIIDHYHLERLIDQLIKHKRTLQALYALSISATEIKQDMEPFIPFIIGWAEQYMGSTNKDTKKAGANPWRGTISSVLDVEENVWSPRYGIKGKIDLTVKAEANGTAKVMPLELKTGKSSFSAEHRGQVILYCMMMSDRRADPEAGLLLYLKDGSMIEVCAGEKEKKGLIQLRNELSFYLRVKKTSKHEFPPLMSLPDPLDSQRGCSRCAHLLTCSSFLKFSGVPLEPHAMATLVPNTLSHLNEGHLEFFRRWCLMLQCEAAESPDNTLNQAIWCMDAHSREDIGDCLADVILKTDHLVEEKAPGHYLHQFTRKLGNSSEFPKTFQVGDSVAISSKKEIALTQGAICSIKGRLVSAMLDRNLKSYGDWESQIYRIDRIGYQATMSINYTNLAYLMEDSPRSATLRRLIIDREEPAFVKGFDKTVISKLRSVMKNLNDQQKRAILRAVLTKDYSILKGFPGTGKTSTIVCLVRVLICLGKSVLLTSNTHSAVDNILLKLKEIPEMKVLRLGRLNRIQEEVRLFSDEILTSNFNSVEEISTFYSGRNVVATTCLGMSHPIFKRRKFDYCIMDEASQVLQLASVGPLLYCERFILVGDSLQLPPIVHSSSARSLGMAESLFERLDVDAATVRLLLQYRMNEPIMQVANRLMYKGQLQCGSEELKNATIQLPLYNISNDDEEPTWMKKSLSESIHDSVVFIDTLHFCPESKDTSDRAINLGECRIVSLILDAFIKFGLQPSNLGVITPFRAQVKLLREQLSCDVEVNTVDQYQGRDKDVILYSCVRSDRSENFRPGVHEILKDLRRLNVATTRAKYKLIIVGDRTTLRNYETFQTLFSILDESQMCPFDPVGDF